MTKLTAQLLTTLGAVFALYGAPWLLGLLPDDGPRFEVNLPSPHEREAVVWLPPQPSPATEAVVDEPTEVDPVATTPTEPEPGPAASDEVAPVEPTLAASSPSPKLQRARRVARPRPARPKVRRVASTRPSKTRRPARTKKQQRRIDRLNRREARREERVMCREMVDLMVHVDHTEDSDTWVVGKPLVNCFRAHPQQFMDMGAMLFAEDTRGKKLGLKVYPSSRPRGEVARALGFQRGDILRSFNGLSLRNHATIGLALTQLTRNKAKLVYLRDGERRTFRVRVVDEDELEAARMDASAVADVDETE